MKTSLKIILPPVSKKEVKDLTVIVEEKLDVKAPPTTRVFTVAEFNDIMNRRRMFTSRYLTL